MDNTKEVLMAFHILRRKTIESIPKEKEHYTEKRLKIRALKRIKKRPQEQAVESVQ